MNRGPKLWYRRGTREVDGVVSGVSRTDHGRSRLAWRAQPAHMRLSISIRKDSGAVIILLDSFSGNAPSALQCDLAILRALPARHPVWQHRGARGQGAHMRDRPNIRRHGALNPPSGQGAQADPYGPIIVIYYLSHQDTRGVTIRSGIEKALRVLADATPIPGTDAEAILGIR
jgi:hypothetical protein